MGFAGADHLLHGPETQPLFERGRLAVGGDVDDLGQPRHDAQNLGLEEPGLDRLARAFLQRATVKVPADFSGERLEVTCNRTAPRSDCARALGRELEVAMRGLGSKRLKVPVRNH